MKMSEIPSIVKEIKNKFSVLSKADIALLTSDGRILFSELTEGVKDLVKGEVERSFRYWDIGDYFAKFLEKTNLIVGKVSDNLALAICSREKPGLLILTFNNVIKMYGEHLKNIESRLKIGKVEEVKPKVEAITKKTVEHVEAPVKAEIPKVSLNTWTVVELTPSIETTAVTMDKDMIRLLRSIDGWKTIEELSRETGIPLEETINKLNYLVSKGVLKSKYDDPAYQRKPKILEGRKIESTFMAFGTHVGLGKVRRLDDVLKLVDGKRTILDIARELGARPEAIKTLFQNLERRRIVELK